MMRMGDCNRQGVGGIWAADPGSWQQARNHCMDLGFFGRASSDDGFLDQSCRIFADLDPGACGAHQNHAACLAKLEGRLGVLVDEDFLNCGRTWRMMIDQCLELVGKRCKASRQRRGRLGPNLPVGDMSEPIAFGLDQPPAGGAEPGVEAEDLQASFSSSSSGTS